IERLRAGGGPEFLEIRVPRILGHYNGDLQLYRSDADKQEHLDRDPVAYEIAASGLTAHEVEAVRAEVEAEVQEALAWAEASPLADVATAADHVIGAVATPAVAPLPAVGKELAYGLAVNRALGVELEERPEVVLFGEDIAIPGGTFGVTRNLRKNFGERVFDTPISETAILGAAVGASIQGLRPVVEIMWSDFMLVAFDQLVNQAANVRYISEGRVTAPLVVRTQQGVTPGSCAQHSQSLEALLAHIPGLRVGMPSTAADAYAMTRAAVAAEDPVILIESRPLYLDKGIVDLDAPVEAVGGARTRRSGSDVLIVTWGRMCDVALEAADELATQALDATVLDLRWLSPLDDAAIARAVADNGGRVVIAHEANLTGGFGAEIAARIASDHFAQLTAPIERVGLPDVRVPSAPALQAAVLPSASHIRDAALRLTAGRRSYAG
ncbi:MAG: transketolase C-terminal domain-containing protein, partial [Humibacter sp.]